MNRGRLLELAAFLEALPAEDFSMDDYIVERYDTCGTVACIAGWQTLRMYPDARMTGDSAFHIAWESLDITYDQAHQLFLPFGRTDYMSLVVKLGGDRIISFGLDEEESISPVLPVHAAAVIRHLVETGEVDWTVAMTLPKQQDELRSDS